MINLSKNKNKLYPLIPAQEMIQFMHTHSIHKQVTQIPDSILIEKEIDFAVLLEALNIEIQRNDCLRLRFCRNNKGKVVQYFLDEYRIENIPLLSFKNEKEQYNYLSADAQKPIRFMKGETYRIKFFRSYDGRYGIYINVHHLVMDNAACFMFFNDLLAVYDSLKYGAEMPAPLGKYEDRIIKDLKYFEDGEAVKKLKQDYRDYMIPTGEPTYLGVEGMKTLEKARKLFHKPELKAPPVYDLFSDKAELLKRMISPEISKKALDYMEANGVSGECLVQLAMRIHVSRINNREKLTYFTVLCPRRRTRDEKRSGGNVTNALPWRIVLEETDTFRDALKKLSVLQVWIFRHMNFPFIPYRELEHELYNYSPITSSPSMMFSWFPIEKNSMNNYEYEYIGYDLGRYVYPLYTLAMKDAKTGCIKISYLHRTKVSSVADIDSLHENTGKIIEMGVENPDITIGEIYDILDGKVNEKAKI